MNGTQHPAWHGGALALLAAVLFGLSTPLVQWAGTGVGPFGTAALLYAGAATTGALLRRPVDREAALRRSDLPRLASMALLGAALGPVALAWGLQHTSAASGSLMLSLEAAFTVLFARMLYGETMDRRVTSAMVLLSAGGIVLIVDRGLDGGLAWMGLAAVLGATVAWGLDNTLSRPLAERDPGQVVLGKSLMGACATLALAAASSEALPPPWRIALLAGIGAIGYGLSLRLYLLAQRAFGAARSGSVFAFAPFVGAAAAVAVGDRSLSWGLAVGAALMLAGVLVHLLETHGHAHAHEELEHEHAHVHGDGHHLHVHVPMPDGAHSHVHRHGPQRHVHAHVPDAHHTHAH